MKILTRLSVLIFLLILISCSGNTSKENRDPKEQKDEVPEETYFTIKTLEEFNSHLDEIGIPIADGLEFTKFKGEILLGSGKDYPTLFSSTYKVSGDNYKVNEEALLNYYKKLFSDSLKSKNWNDSSHPGTGILDFHNFKGIIKTVSIQVTTSDVASKTGKQDLTISLWVR